MECRENKLGIAERTSNYKQSIYIYFIVTIIIIIFFTMPNPFVELFYLCSLSTDEIRQDMEDVIARMRPWYVE